MPSVPSWPWKPPEPNHEHCECLGEVFEQLGEVREALAAQGRQMTDLKHVVTRDSAALGAQLVKIIDNEEKIMAGQDSIDAAVAALNAFLTDLGTAVANIQAELASVAPAVNTDALDALVAQLPAVQASVDALESAPPATP